MRALASSHNTIALLLLLLMHFVATHIVGIMAMFLGTTAIIGLDQRLRSHADLQARTIRSWGYLNVIVDTVCFISIWAFSGRRGGFHAWARAACSIEAGFCCLDGWLSACGRDGAVVRGYCLRRWDSLAADAHQRLTPAVRLDYGLGILIIVYDTDPNNDGFGVINHCNLLIS